MEKNQSKKVLCGVDGSPCSGRCKAEHTKGFNVFCERLIVKEGKKEQEVKVFRAF